MYIAFFITILFNLIFSTKRKHEQTDDLSSKRLFYENKIQEIPTDKIDRKNLKLCKKITENKNHNNIFTYETISNVELFDEISTDLFSNQINFSNFKQIKDHLKNYNLILSMFIYNVVMSSDCNLQSDYEMLTKICGDIINNENNDNFCPTSSTYIEQAIEKIKANKEKKENDIIKELLQNKETIFQNNFLHVKNDNFDLFLLNFNKDFIVENIFKKYYFADCYFKNTIIKYKFFNNLLYSFFVTDKFYDKIKKIYNTTKIENNISFIEIFSASSIELNKQDCKPFYTLNENSDYYNKKENKQHSLNKVDDNYVINFKILPTSEKNEKSSKITFLSLENYPNKKYENYFFDLKIKDIDILSRKAKNLHDNIYANNIDIVSKQSIQYIMTQIAEIENTYTKIAFYIVLFRAIMINERIKKSITKIILLLEIYKQANIQEKNDINFQINLWYYLIISLNFKIETIFSHVYNVLRDKFTSYINKSKDIKNFKNFIEYYSYLLFLLLEDQVHLDIRFKMVENKNELPVDLDYCRTSKMFLHFILKILFDNNLLKKD